MTRYFKITGLDMGIPIEPYIVAQTNDPRDRTLNIHLETYGDQVRYYQSATKEEYEKDIEKIEKLEKIPMPQISLFDYYKNKKRRKKNEKRTTKI